MQRHRLLWSALLLVCILATGCSKGQAEVADTGAPVVKDVAGQEAPKGESMRNELQEAVEFQLETQGAEGDWAVYVKGLDSGSSVLVNEKPMRAASLIKLFIAGTVYENLEMMRQQDLPGSSTDELMHAMITVSDNDASNTLITRLGNGDAAAGMKLVNAYCEEHAYGNTHLGRMLLGSNAEDDNYTSVGDCGRFLEEVYRGSLAGSQELLELMKQQTRTGKIPAGLPEGVLSANKTGELSDVENDAAIVWGEKEVYILCVMSDQLTDPGQACQEIQAVSAAVYAELAK